MGCPVLGCPVGERGQTRIPSPRASTLTASRRPSSVVRASPCLCVLSVVLPLIGARVRGIRFGCVFSKNLRRVRVQWGFPRCACAIPNRPSVVLRVVAAFFVPRRAVEEESGTRRVEPPVAGFVLFRFGDVNCGDSYSTRCQKKRKKSVG